MANNRPRLGDETIRASKKYQTSKFQIPKERQRCHVHLQRIEIRLYVSDVLTKSLNDSINNWFTHGTIMETT